MSLLKAAKGLREVLKQTFFKKGVRVYISKTGPIINKAAKREVHSHNNVRPKFNSTFLRSVLSRTSQLFGRHTITSLQPRYAGVNRLRNVPVFSLIGLSLGLDVDELTDSYMDSTMSAVRNIFKDYKWEPACLEFNPESLDDLEINRTSVIGNGCEGAVFEAKLKDDTLVAGLQMENKTRGQDYNLAVKAVFNYGAESNASSILRDLKREIIPLQPSESKSGLMEDVMDTNVLRLPPHPNVVEMHSIFVDDMLVTEQGRREFPAAMPSRINPERCFGRNKTLYLVMRKCTTKLSDFLSSNEVSMTTRCLLLTQLLESVRHMTSHGVAHRDIKADNILIDVPVSGGTPRLQVCDFGCCLAEESRKLEIPFVSNDVNVGGNSWLMPPEISCAKAGESSVLDFRKSDLWACGALAYQILGTDNPFYPNNVKQLKSRTYTEDELPPLPGDVPAPIVRLVRSLLSRDPAKRPSPIVAVLVVQMVAWESTSRRRHPTVKKRPNRVVVTKGNRMSSYVHYLDKERQKMGLVLAEMLDLIRKMTSRSSLERQDVIEISNFMCLSRLSHSDFVAALKFFH